MSETKTPPEAEQETKQLEQELKPEACPFCDYRTSRASLLSRHINHHHAEVRAQTPKVLLKAMDGQASLPDMLKSVAGYIEENSGFSDKLPDDVINYLRREDVKTQLILRVMAIEKIKRAIDMGDMLKKLDGELQKKLSENEEDEDSWKHKMNPSQYLGLMERLQQIQENELKFLKEIVSLGEINLADVVEKLIDGIGAASLKPGSASDAASITAFQLTGVNLPTDPAEREKIRTILPDLLTAAGYGTPDGNGSSKTIDSSPVASAPAGDAKGPGTDTVEDK